MREWTAAAMAVMAGLGAAVAAESPDCAVGAQLATTEHALPRVAAAVDRARALDIVVMGAGSSTLAGPGGTDLAYPARLQIVLSKRLPGVNTKVVTNVKSRRSAAEMTEGFEKVLMEEKPVLVIWQSGTVDAITGVDSEDYRATLEEGIELLHAGGADVVLMNMQYSPRTDSMIAIQAYADNMRLVAQQREVPLFDRFAIMRQWHDQGDFDLFSTSHGLDLAKRVHDCLGRALAQFVIEAAHLKPAQQN